MNERKLTQGRSFVDRLYDLEPESGVYFGSIDPEADRALFEKYPISRAELLELKTETIRRLAREVSQADAALAEEYSLEHSYHLQRKVQALRSELLTLENDLLDLSFQIAERMAAELVYS